MSLYDELLQQARIERTSRIGQRIEDVGSVAHGLSHNNIRQAAQESIERFQGPDREDVFKELQRAFKTSKAAHRGVSELGAAAQQSGNPAVVERAKKGLLSAGSAAANVGKSAIQQTLEVIDKPASLARQGLTGEAEVPAFLEEFRRRFPHASAGIDAFATPLSAVGGVLGAGVGAAGDVLSGRNLGDVAKDFTAVVGESIEDPRDAGDFLTLMLVDPLSYVGFGGGAPAKVLAKQAAKIARTAGRADKAADLSKAFVDIYSKHASSPRFIGKMEAALKEVGIPEDVWLKVLGKDLEAAGRSGLRLAGLELVARNRFAPIEEPVGKLARAAKRKAGGFAPEVPREYGGQHAARGVVRALQQTRNRAIKQVHDEMSLLEKRVVNEVDKYISPERKSELLKDYIDPNFDVSAESVAVSAAELSASKKFYGPLSSQRLIDQEDHFLIQTRDGRLLASVDPDNGYRPVRPGDGEFREVMGFDPEKALNLQGLDGAERRYVEIIRDHLERQWDRLVLEGVLTDSKYAFNWVSGMYVPRRFKGDPADIFGQVRKDSQVGRATPNFTKARTGVGGSGRPVAKGSTTVKGRKLTPETDLDQVITNYQYAAEAKLADKYFDKWIADHFGDMERAGDGFFHALRDTNGNTSHVPQAVYDAARSAYNEAFKPIRKTFFDAVMDVFKTNVLMSVPRYHMVNISGDGLLMALNGFKSPKRLKDARRIFDPKTPDGQVVLVSPAGKRWTKGELNTFLRENGVGTQAGHFDLSPDLPRASRLEAATRKGAGQVASGLRSLPRGKRALQVSQDVGAIGLNRVGRHVAGVWDETAKGAFFLTG